MLNNGLQSVTAFLAKQKAIGNGDPRNRTPGWNFLETLLRSENPIINVHGPVVDSEDPSDPMNNVFIDSFTPFRNCYSRNGDVFPLAARLIDNLNHFELLSYDGDNFSVAVNSEIDHSGLMFILCNLNHHAGSVPNTDEGIRLLEFAWILSDTRADQAHFLRSLKAMSNSLLGYHVALLNMLDYHKPIKLVKGREPDVLDDDWLFSSETPSFIRFPLISRSVAAEMVLEVEYRPADICVDNEVGPCIPRLMFRMDDNAPWSELVTPTYQKLREYLERFCQLHRPVDSHLMLARQIKSAYHQ